MRRDPLLVDRAAGLYVVVGVVLHVGPVERLFQQAPGAPQSLVGCRVGGLQERVSTAARDHDAVVLVHE